MARKCEQCGGDLTGTQQKKFCGHACWYESRKWDKVGVCEGCGNTASSWNRRLGARSNQPSEYITRMVTARTTGPRTWSFGLGVDGPKKDPHGVRVVDKVLDLMSTLKQDELVRVAEKLKELL